MAIGDDALAANLPVMTGAEQANALDEEINLTRDIIARRTYDVQPVSKGGTGATTAALARTSLGAAAREHTHDAGDITGGVLAAARIPNLSAGKLTTGTMTRPVDTNSDVKARDLVASRDITAGGKMTAGGAWEYNITSGSRRAVWMDTDGTLGHTASSERYKRDVRPVTPLTDEQFLQLQVVSYRWLQGEQIEVGMIAERLHELGLWWAVFYDAEGLVEGIHYDRVVLAVLPYVQQLALRMIALEQRLDTLGGDK